MANFSDAFDEGEKIKQQREDRERQKQAAEDKQAAEQIAAAKKWIQDELIPVVESARRDLVGKVSITDQETRVGRGSEVVASRQIFLTPAGAGKRPCQITIHVTASNAVNVYHDDGKANTLGSITSVSKVQITQMIEKTLRDLADKQ